MLTIGLLAAAVVAGGATTSGASAPDVPSGPTTIVDDVGRSIELDLPVTRAAVFNSQNSELIRAIGAADAIVGVDEGTINGPSADYWPELTGLPTVGTGQSEPNYEQLVEADPQIVIIPRNGAWEEAETKLAPFGIEVVVVTGWDLPPHYDNVELLGTIFGKVAEAEAFNDFCYAQRDLLVERLADVEAGTVYLENQRPWFSPVPGAGWHEMIELGGGTNIFEDIVITDGQEGNVNSFEIDPEAVITRDPDLILRTQGSNYGPTSAEELEATRDELLDRPGFGDLTAVQNGNLVVSDSFIFNGCGKQLGGLYIASWLYPEALDGVDVDAIVQTYIEDFQGVPLADIADYYIVGGG